MSRRSETPFDNIEGSHDYVSLLAEAVQQAVVDVESDIATADADAAARRKQALQLVHYNLKRLEAHVTSSRRILNDLRTLRRLLLEERTLDTVVQRAATASVGDNR